MISSFLCHILRLSNETTFETDVNSINILLEKLFHNTCQMRFIPSGILPFQGVFLCFFLMRFKIHMLFLMFQTVLVPESPEVPL